MERFALNTSSKQEFIDITANVEKIVKDEKINCGLAVIYIPHTTAGITINENADRDVRLDMKAGLERIVPSNVQYLHSEGNSPAHIKSSLMKNSETVFIEEGKLQLGTWQGIFFMEFDGPRSREVWVKLLKSE